MSLNKNVPSEDVLDSTLDLIRDGYLFIKNRTDRYNSKLFQTRFLLKKVICISGRDAAELFYDPEKFQRYKAAPKRVQKTLFGVNAIQSMDGEDHIHRKKLFMSLVTPIYKKQLAMLFMNQLDRSIEEWEGLKSIVLFKEAERILCRVACSWAGVPLEECELLFRAEDFSAMVDAFGGMGPRYSKGKIARVRTEKWIKELINDVRNGKITAKKDSALEAVANYKDIKGKHLDNKMAAIELINILRPVVAIATYIVFTALALYEHPGLREKLELNQDNYIEMFVQEVRRCYPFTPFLAAKARKDFIWNQCLFKKDTIVLLDIYGTNHDPKIWDNPNEFNPERFINWRYNPFEFVPQGGGDPAKGHRCPGEGITVELMRASVDFLVNKIEYKVLEQDLSYNLRRMPAIPKSRFIMSNIKRK